MKLVMKENTKQIKFQNLQNPNAKFDLLRLEELYSRDNLNHNIEKHHKVEFYIILIIVEGSGNHTIDFKDYTLSKGSLLTVRKDQIHKFQKSEFSKGKLILFTNEFLVNYLEELESQKTLLLFNELLGDPKIQLEPKALNSISQSISRIENEYFNINDNHSMGIIRSELHILISNLFRLKTKKELINTEKKYLKEFLVFQEKAEKKVFETTKVKDFAQMLGLSTKTLNTVTKAIIHKTAKEFVDEICIKQIKRLLTNTDLSVKEIAYQSGFEETTNFYKYFKRQSQVTPEQFRASN